MTVGPVVLAGRTDWEITAEVLIRARIEPTEDLLREIFSVAIEEFRGRRPDDMRDLTLPGVRETLAQLAEAGGKLGLVTGNVEAIAWEKMKVSGLEGFFQFGAFGSESPNRADLPLLAAARAGGHFRPDQTYIIGDTPRDIDCGYACEMKTIAIATGRYSLEELQAYSPTFSCQSMLEFAQAVLRREV